MNLSDKALLVQLNVSQWEGRKTDKKAGRDLATMHGVSDSLVSARKQLLANDGALKDIHRKTTVIRTEFYRNTLPWGIDGTFILPTTNYLNFMTEFRKHKHEWQSLVDAFLYQYQWLVQDSRRELGSLFDETNYPSVERMGAKFSMDMTVLPVPSTDFRVQVSSDELTRIQQDLEARLTSAHQAAMQEVWKRLYDRVAHIASKLADPAAIFRDSMMENAREICELLPRLNFADDPHLEEMRRAVEDTLLTRNTESLRVDMDLRRDVASEAQSIVDRMAVFMGGNPQ
jgi:hypothetical protein